jgi:Lrp/AsnC family leucine-responsive transcriptional regulator
MSLFLKETAMDALDQKAVRLLIERGRATWAELGQVLGLSAPAAADRVRRLEERGIIRGYAALVDAGAVGYPLVAYILVTLGDTKTRLRFLKDIAKLEEICECHHIAGDEDYLLKVRCRGTADLDRLLADKLKGRLGVLRTRTTIVLSTAKETVRVPIDSSDQVNDSTPRSPRR